MDDDKVFYVEAFSCMQWTFLSHLSRKWQPTLKISDRPRNWYYPRGLSNRYPAVALPGNKPQRGQPGETRPLPARLLSHADNTGRRAIHTTEGRRWTKSSQTDCVPWNTGPPRGLPATTNLALHFTRLMISNAMHSVPVQALLTGTSAGAKWRRTSFPPRPTSQINIWRACRPMPLGATLTKNNVRTQTCALILFSQNYPGAHRQGWGVTGSLVGNLMTLYQLLQRAILPYIPIPSYEHWIWQPGSCTQSLEIKQETAQWIALQRLLKPRLS